MKQRKPPPNHDLLRERFAQQMSRAQLAKRSGVTAKTLREHEMKGTRMRLDNAGRVAKALNKNVSDLFSEDSVIG